MAINCNEIKQVATELKMKFESCKVLEASDMDRLVELIEAVSTCVITGEISQDNLLKIINLSNVTKDKDIVNQINSLPLFEVLETEIAVFEVNINNILHKYVLNIGKGLYGQGSGVNISLNDLTLIYKQTKIKEDLIYVTLNDLGATSFDDNLPQLIKDYAIANSITKEDESLHSWIVEEDVRPFEIMSNGVTLRLKTELGFGVGTTGLADNDTSGTIYEAVDTAGLYNISYTSSPKPLYQYCTTLVDDMSGLFQLFYSELRPLDSYLNENLSNWDTSNVLNMAGMFRGQNVFNNNNNIDTGMPGLNSISNTGVIGIDNWDVSKVTDMSEMFEKDTYSSVYPDVTTPPFNQPLNNWDVSSVTNMSDMFKFSRLFNQQLDNWNVSNVTDMSFMFHYAVSFNQPLNVWDVSNVTDMEGMFDDSYDFNQNLTGWCVTNIPTEPNRFAQPTFAPANRPVWGTCP